MKQGRLREFFRMSGAESLALFSSEGGNPNFFYYSGLSLDNSVFIARRDGQEKLLVNRINETEAGESGLDALVWKNRRDFWKNLKAELAGTRSVSIDASSLRASAYVELRKRLGGKRAVDSSRRMLEQRAVKDEGEIRLLRKSARLARMIIDSADIRTGRAEQDIAKELKVSAFEKGAELSFEPIVASGKNSAMPHAKPGRRRIAAGDAVLVDYGVKLNGYCSDISRCFFIGGCPEERKNYGSLKESFRELVETLSKGIELKKIPGVCNGIMKKRGFGSMIHSPGHGIGLDIHEVPSLSIKSGGKLAENMAIAIEPAVYYPGKYGLRYEDDLVIERGKARLI